VRQVTILKGVNLKATGFTHKFAPPVSLLEASTWYVSFLVFIHPTPFFFPDLLCRLVKQNGQQVFTLDITFLFTNNNGLIFLNGTYAEFDDFDDVSFNIKYNSLNFSYST
jgi:hypothetical protein